MTDEQELLFARVSWLIAFFVSVHYLEWYTFAAFIAFVYLLSFVKQWDDDREDRRWHDLYHDHSQDGDY